MGREFYNNFEKSRYGNRETQKAHRTAKKTGRQKSKDKRLYIAELFKLFKWSIRHPGIPGLFKLFKPFKPFKLFKLFKLFKHHCIVLINKVLIVMYYFAFIKLKRTFEISYSYIHSFRNK